MAEGAFHTPETMLERTIRILDSGPSWLVMYFVANLGLTIFNKAVMQLNGFGYPWLLTSIHTLFSAIGASICTYLFLPKSSIKPIFTGKETVLLLFSVLYTVNIAVSNISLNMVTLPFHQVVRSTTPFFTVAISFIFLSKTFSLGIYVSLIPIVSGVVLATYGDISYTALGFALTVLGTILAALKTIVTNQIQVGPLKFQPMDFLWRMSFLAFFQTLIFSYFTGEMKEMWTDMSTKDHTGLALILVGNGLVAFWLNVVSFTANKKTSALTMTVAANIKQVLTILISIVFFHVPVTFLNAAGILVTILGGMQYTAVEYLEKTEASSKEKNVPV